MKINKELLWDYDLSKLPNDESFRIFYLSRVLTRGGDEDIRALDKKELQRDLPKIFLPPRIRRFWEWYFDKRSSIERSDGTSKGTSSLPGKNPT